MEIKRERNYSIELLRVIAMIGIVLLHTQMKTGWLQQHSVGHVGWLGSWGIHACCMVSVNLYVLITGYFMPGSTRSTGKVFSLWKSAVVWGVLILGLALFLDAGAISPKDLIRAFLPISTRQYWFLTVYVALYLLSPYLDQLLGGLTKKQYQGLLSILICLFSLFPSLVPWGGEDGVYGINGLGGTNIAWFCVLYAVAGYLRRFAQIEKLRRYRIWSLAIYVVSILGMLAFQFCMELVQNRIGSGGSYGTWFLNYSSILNLTATLGLFVFFLTMELRLTDKTKKTLMFFSQGAFGVYLIHENPKMRPILWGFVQKIDEQYLAGVNYTCKILLVAGGIFVVFCFLENCRKKISGHFLHSRVVALAKKTDSFLYPGESMKNEGV